MKEQLHKFAADHYDGIITILVGANGFTLLLTDLDLVLKCAIGAATFAYLIIKIRKELKNK